MLSDGGTFAEGKFAKPLFRVAGLRPDEEIIFIVGGLGSVGGFCVVLARTNPDVAKQKGITVDAAREAAYAANPAGRFAAIANLVSRSTAVRWRRAELRGLKE